jgi:hypothetical protein
MRDPVRRTAWVRRAIQALHILVATGLIVFAFVTRTADLFAALVYVSVGIPIALVIALGLSLGGSSGMSARIAGCALVALVATIGGSASWPIAMAGGTLWWWALLLVALVGAVVPLQAAQGIVDAGTTRRMPRWRDAVVGVQAVLALCVVVLLMVALSNAEGISGIVLPLLLVPFATVVVAGIAYWRAVRWPVILANVPLFLFAFLVGREELTSPYWGEEPERLLMAVGIALLTGFSVVAALLPPKSIEPATI